MTTPHKRMAILSPVAWRTPPRQYGAWETAASNITEGLVSRGWDMTLFATKDSVTRAHLHAVVDRGYEEDPAIDPKVAEYLHISEAFEHATEFDLIHSHYDFMALSYTRLVKTPVLTTIHGFSSPRIMPVYEKYRDGYFVSISNADRAPGMNYLATVYNGIDLSLYPLQKLGGDHLIFLGRIHPDKGVHLAIEVARLSGFRLGPPAVRCFCTVRGETRIPSFSFNSLAMRSSPQVGFSAAIFRINPWRSLGNRGRPTGLDFHRQNSRKPLRCHRIRVSGLTTTSAARQSTTRLRNAISHLVESFA